MRNVFDWDDCLHDDCFLKFSISWRLRTNDFELKWNTLLRLELLECVQQPTTNHKTYFLWGLETSQHCLGILHCWFYLTITGSRFQDYHHFVSSCVSELETLKILLGLLLNRLLEGSFVGFNYFNRCLWIVLSHLFHKVRIGSEYANVFVLLSNI